MSPLDDELRDLLHSRGGGLAPSPDPLAGIERRARTMRRNRVAASVAASALAVAAVAAVVPALQGSSGPDRQVPQVASAEPSVPPTALPAAGLDPARPWDYRGDLALVAGDNRTSLEQEWRAAGHPGSTVTPLFGQVYEPSGQTEVVFLATADGGHTWGLARSGDAGWEFPFSQPLQPGAPVLMAPLDGDEVPRLLVLAAPSTGDIAYAADGRSYRSLPMPFPGVAFRGLEGDTSNDAVRVLDGDGDLDAPVFQGPAPDPAAPAGPTTPAQVTPPAETSSAPTLAARYAFVADQPWAYRGAPPDGTGDIVSTDRKAFITRHGERAGQQDTPLYVAHLSATTDVAVVLHSRDDGDWVTFTAHQGTSTHQVEYEPAPGEDVLSAYLPLDASHGLLVAVASDRAANVVLQTGDRAEVGGSRTAGIWDWSLTADPQARLAAFAAGDAEPYASQPAT